MAEPSSVTRLLTAIEAGEAGAWDALLTMVYGELRGLAARRMRNESGRHTLDPTALVHEAYLRLLGDKPPAWRNRADFFTAAAEAMRRILVDHARRRNSLKRGGEGNRMPLDDVAAAPSAGDAFPDLAEDVEALDRALARLEQDRLHREKCAIVKLRYFAGFTLDETAEALGKSVATIKRDWTFAKAWLYREMTKGD